MMYIPYNVCKILNPNTTRCELYWSNDIQFTINKQDLLLFSTFLHNEDLQKILSIHENNIDILFIRTTQSKLSPGNFIAYNAKTLNII